MRMSLAAMVVLMKPILRAILGFAVILAALPIAGRAADMQSMSGTDMKGMGRQMPSAAQTFPFGHPGTAARVDRVIHVTATEYKYLPAAISVRAGETVKFVVTNKGMLDHEFVLGTVSEQKEHEREMAAHPGREMHDPNGITIPKGRTASLIWTFTRPMTIQYACHVAGHYGAGMYGMLTIKPDRRAVSRGSPRD
jgi:uncharacterized cupredoxin-like copper-binding protein